MSVFGYVAPEQAQKDKADFARKGIARGRSLVGMSFTGGVLLCAENKSRNLHKLGEIYDHIAFAGVGKYNEFDQLRQAGIRSADLKGYQYSREDVDARSLANGYAQLIGQVFTHEMKPLEVEILVAEVGVRQEEDQLFHILYDGTVVDEEGTSVLGGDADALAERLSSTYDSSAGLDDALKTAVAALAGPDRTLGSADLEVAILERGAVRRCFRRIRDGALVDLLGPAADAPPEPGPATAE
jgi:proteasome alpha subunit